MPTFDVVSELDMQEVTNAIDQANRETTTRYDFRDTNTTFELKENTIVVESASEGRMEAAIDVLQTKFLKRGLSIKALSGGDVKPASGGRVRAVFELLSGIPQDAAKELNKSIKDQKLKVQVQIQGDQLRVQGKKRDDLQEVIAHLKSLDFRVPLQFTNFRD
ncbi:MAG: YajQ family cyclic di-GMP-binding protein [Acidimicrobiia bacterium]|nr:YajQ family cyclic di-GMP-binding protein [Acidimicrobiia bacterium]MDH5422115.1 YajQ family cyclic di-GMP-binding protein [Acidimicrobiia bacterium]MDH5502806.1 YajQ family cyclic di-GMP-binding protein [Acidimicrobiia bacterium]